MTGICLNMNRYFAGHEEVASVFVKPANQRTCAERAVAVLVKDAGLSQDELARLEAIYSFEATGLGSDAVHVEVLNSSPASHQYRVIKDWKLIFERNRQFRTWFFDHAAAAQYAMEPAA